MKKPFILLAILLPFCSNAQKLELSLKGGVAPNTFARDEGYGGKIEKNTAYIGSVSLTAGLPKNFRVGMSVSAYNLEYTHIGIDEGPLNDVVPQTYYRYGNPIMPVELMLLKRFEFNRLSFDAGLTGGMSVNKKMFSGNDRSDARESVGTIKGTWYTYGALAAGQVNISKRFAVGAEAQAKRQHMGYNGRHRVFAFPVMLKASVRI